MKRFSTENKHCSSYRDVLEEYPDKDGSYLSKVLAGIVNTGMLRKLSWDLYCIIPPIAAPVTYPSDLPRDLPHRPTQRPTPETYHVQTSGLLGPVTVLYTN